MFRVPVLMGDSPSCMLPSVKNRSSKYSHYAFFQKSAVHWEFVVFYPTFSLLVCPLCFFPFACGSPLSLSSLVCGVFLLLSFVLFAFFFSCFTNCFFRLAFFFGKFSPFSLCVRVFCCFLFVLITRLSPLFFCCFPLLLCCFDVQSKPPEIGHQSKTR